MEDHGHRAVSDIGVSIDELLDSAPDGVVVIDHNGTIRLVNRQAEALFGYDRVELIGQPVELLVPDRARAQHPEHRSRYFASPTIRPMGFELSGRRKDGSEFRADISLSSLQSAEGILAYAAVRDVTHSRLAAIVQSSADAMIGKLLDGTITSWNRGAEHLYGYSAAEIVGRNISLLVPADRAEELHSILARIARGDRVDHYESQRIRKDRTLVDVSVAVSPIHGPAGTVIGASAVARDVTERKRADTERARQTEELRRSNAELEQFAYVASHDLSEPLRTISGYAELLARRYRGQIDDDADRFIRHTVEGCQRMRQLIDDMLLYSRAGRAPELTEMVDTAQIVRHVVASMDAALSETAGTVDYRDLPAIRGDPVQLAQLFQNLIANSIKFAPAGTPPRVRIEAERHTHGWTFSVADNGIGIETEYRQRIFGMFQRLHGRDDYPGTGIGLAICLRVVQAHGGRIWVDDNPQGGTCVHFTLPAHANAHLETQPA
jgi:PAS domain S-box-containing protein